MNVIGSRPDGWWKNRRGAMALVLSILVAQVERPMSPPIDSSVIEIRHAPRAAANSADDEIVRLVTADDRPQEINVVTSDIALADRVRNAGASVYPAASFRNLIDPR